MKCRLPVLAAVLGLVPLLNANPPVTVKVQVPSSQSSERLVLQIDGLQLPRNSSGVIRIYANMPEADTTTGTSTDHFLGYLALVARTSREAPVERNVSLDVSGKLSELKGKHEVSITLVPMSGPETTAQSSEKLTYRRIRLSPRP